jgi:hypothetical protein
MTFDTTAWQKAEMLETGVDRSVSEVYWRSSAGTSDGFGLLRPLADLGAGLEEDGRVLLEAG